MLPSIFFIDSVELIRDGGSLCAQFRSSNSSKYKLLFKLRRQYLPSGEMERLGYEEPIVVDLVSSLLIRISWQHAIVLLNQMRPLLQNESDLKYHEAMIESAENSGALPTGFQRIL